MPTLAEELGYAADAKLLIVNCDDLGSSPRRERRGVRRDPPRHGDERDAHGAVPVVTRRGRDVPRRRRRRAPHAQRPSGRRTAGARSRTRRACSTATAGSPEPCRTRGITATSTRSRKECRTQIERAILWGFDISHLDSHMGTLQLRADFFDVYLEMAVEFDLPLRMPGASAERTIGFPFRRLAAEEGVVFPDHFVNCPVGARRRIEKTLFDLRPGVTEVLPAPRGRQRRAAQLAPRLGLAGRGPRVPHERPVVSRARRARRRDARSATASSATSSARSDRADDGRDQRATCSRARARAARGAARRSRRPSSSCRA